MRLSLIAFACLAAAAAIFFLWDPAADSSDLASRGETAAATAEAESISALDAVDGRGEDAREVASATVPAASPAMGGAEGTVEAAASSARIVGRVTDVDGQGLGEGDVVLRRTRSLFDRDADESPSPVEADGSFALEVEPGGVVLVAGADGYAALERSLEIRAGETVDVGELRLAPGVRLSGRVVDEAGRPVAGALIRTSRTDTPAFMAGLGNGPGAELSDVDGRFTVTRQAPGPYAFRVSHRAYPTESFTGRTERAGEHVDGIEVVLRVGGEITGLVAGIDTLSSATREGLAISVRRPGTADDQPLHRPRRVGLEPDGTFAIRGLEVGAAYTLQLETREGFFDPRGKRSQPVPANTGDRGVVLEWDDGATLRFRLADPDGQPITGAQVAFESMRMSTPSAAEEPEPGLYVLDHLWPTSDGGPRIEAGAPGYESWVLKPPPFAGTADMDLGTITLSSRPTLTVTVLDRASGDPVEGALVAVEVVPETAPSDGSLEVRSFSVSIGGDGPGAPSAVVQTDAEGRAVLEVTPGERVHVDVAHATYAEARFGPFALDRNASSFTETVRVDPGGAVRVVLRDDLGQPVTARHVHRRTVLGRAAQDVGVSNGDGEVHFPGLAPGAHGFRVGERVKERAMMFDFGLPGAPAPEYDWIEVEVLAGETVELVLDAPRPTSVRGVVTEAGVALSGARVQFEGDSNPGGMPMFAMSGGPSAVTDARGHYVLDGLDPGEGTLVISHPRRAMPERRPVELDPGVNESDVELGLAIVSGVVYGVDGEPLPGARVRAKEANPTGGRMSFAVMVVGDEDPVTFGSDDAAEPTTTDADGRYELRGVTPDVELIVHATFENGDGLDSEPFEVPVDGRRDDVDLYLAPAGALTIELPGNEGTVSVILARGVHAPRLEEVTGETRTFDDLAPGTYNVSVIQDGGRPGDPPPENVWTPESLEVEIRARETATAHFERE